MSELATTNVKPSKQARLELDAIPEAVLQAAHVIRGIARTLRLGSTTAKRLTRAVCEVVLNACTYAYPNDAGKVVLQVAQEDGCLQIVVTDFGRGFRCEDYFRPDGSRGPNAHHQTGLFLAANAVDRLSIESGKQGTTVKMVKRIGGGRKAEGRSEEDDRTEGQTANTGMWTPD